MFHRMRPLTSGFYRLGYFAAMYSGARALYNRARSRTQLLDPRLQSLSTVEVGKVVLDVKAHSRPSPRPDRAGERFAMLSLKLRRPPIPRWLYRMLCATSHFGLAHIEVALFVEADTVSLYAVRDIVGANARRVGLARAAERIRLRRPGDTTDVLLAVAEALTARGFLVRHAPASECVALSVDERLLPAHAREAAAQVLRRKYERSRARFASS